MQSFTQNRQKPTGQKTLTLIIVPPAGSTVSCFGSKAQVGVCTYTATLRDVVTYLQRERRIPALTRLRPLNVTVAHPSIYSNRVCIYSYVSKMNQENVHFTEM